MRIGLVGLNLPEGKVKYQDPRLLELEKKLAPKKTHPLFVEFIKEGFESADIIACLKEKVLDILILDMEKLEKRLQASGDDFERTLLKRCISSLEKEKPVCDMELSEKELGLLVNIAPLSLKPMVITAEDMDADECIKKCLEKSGTLFFYTAARGELKSWPLKKGTDILTAASKIHSDLARGFIKAEVVNFKDFLTAHNLNEARSKGLVKVVDKSYPVEDGDIVEVKFNV